MSQDKQDLALLIYISIFFYLKAILIMREGWLGRALCWASFVCGLLFTYAVLLKFYPHLRNDLRYIGTIRLLMVTTLTWAIGQLIYARYLAWKYSEDDTRKMMWIRERVVGRRERVATKREGAVMQREDRMTKLHK